MQLIQISSLKSKEENNNSKKVAIGIDLGTTNTVVARFEGGKINIIDGDIPSVVAFAKGKKTLYGKEALHASNQYIKIRSIKRLIGKKMPDIKHIVKFFPAINSDKEGNIFFDIFGKIFTPSDIMQKFIVYVKLHSEEILQKKITDAIITVPAYFDNMQRNVVQLVAKNAGLNVMRFVSEPTAAALSYGLDDGKEGDYLVYDLGGGTFDVSFLTMQKGILKVLATGGNNTLGGDDFDIILFNMLVSPKMQDKLEHNQKQELILKAKKFKEELTSTQKAKFSFDDGNFKLEKEIITKDFEKEIEKVVEKTINICKQVVNESGKDFDSIKEIIFVGGSTLMPYIKQKVKKSLKKDILNTLNPEHVVALGAAHLASMLSGENENSLLLDVLPLSLGIEAFGGIFEKIIEKNSTIPIAKAQKFTTHQNQDAILINIYQGERDFVVDNRFLGSFILNNLSNNLAGAVKVLVTFFVDADGILKVSAMDEGNQNSKEIEIKPSWGLNMEEATKMVQDGFANAKEDMEKRLLTTSKIEAQKLIKDLQFNMKEHKDLLSIKLAEDLQMKILQLKQALTKDDRQKIDKCVQKLQNISTKFIKDCINSTINLELKNKDVKEV